MRIASFGHFRFPTEKAHGYQAAQVCRALAALGNDVTFVVPDIAGTQDNPFAYYGMDPTFVVDRLKHVDAFQMSWLPYQVRFVLSMFSYRRCIRAYMRSHAYDVLLCRSIVLLPALLSGSVPVIFEVHDLPRWRRHRFVALCNRCHRVVCMTSLIRESLLASGVHADRMVVEGDAVDLGRFMGLPSASSAKEQWALPAHVPVIGYVGSLVTRETLDKGAGQLIEAVALLKERGMQVQAWIVGGPHAWIDRLRMLARQRSVEGQVRFEGWISSSRVPVAMAACDVLVYPAPQTDHPFFLRDTSPMKLFEYCASRRPVICADLPPLHDSIDHSMVRWYAPGDVAGLSDAIMEVMRQPAEAQHRVENAWDMVQRHTWEQRMERIIAPGSVARSG